MSTKTFSRFDVADYLNTEEDIALYLEAVMEEASDDPALIAHALDDAARARNMSQQARDNVSRRQG